MVRRQQVERSTSCSSGRRERGVQRRRHRRDRQRDHGGGRCRGQPHRDRPGRHRADRRSGDAYTAALDPEGATGAELLEGYTYKESTGVAFDGSSESAALVTQLPEISEDGRSMTIVYDSFYVDYAVSEIHGDTPVPAHAVAASVLGVEDPTEGKQAIVDAIQTAFDGGDTADLKAISEFWNTGFDATALPSDPGVYLSFGPYLLTAYDELSQMTFEANPDYTWGPRPQVETIVYRIIGDPTAAVQAMENEEIDIIQPQATADILTSSRRSPTAASRC